MTHAAVGPSDHTTVDANGQIKLGPLRGLNINREHAVRIAEGSTNDEWRHLGEVGTRHVCHLSVDSLVVSCIGEQVVLARRATRVAIIIQSDHVVSSPSSALSLSDSCVSAALVHTSCVSPASDGTVSVDVVVSLIASRTRSMLVVVRTIDGLGSAAAAQAFTLERIAFYGTSVIQLSVGMSLRWTLTMTALPIGSTRHNAGALESKRIHLRLRYSVLGFAEETQHITGRSAYRQGSKVIKHGTSRVKPRIAAPQSVLECARQNLSQTSNATAVDIHREESVRAV